MSSDHFALAMMFSCGATPVMGPETSVDVTGAYARMICPATRLCGVFMQISNHSGQADRLISVSSDVSNDAHLNDAVKNPDDIAGQHLAKGGFDIADGETLMLAPHGKQITLSGLARSFEKSNQIRLTLCFEKAGIIEIDTPLEIQHPDGRSAA